MIVGRHALPRVTFAVECIGKQLLPRRLLWQLKGPGIVRLRTAATGGGRLGFHAAGGLPITAVQRELNRESDRHAVMVLAQAVSRDHHTVNFSRGWQLDLSPFLRRACGDPTVRVPITSVIEVRNLVNRMPGEA